MDFARERVNEVLNVLNYQSGSCVSSEHPHGSFTSGKKVAEIQSEFAQERPANIAPLVQCMGCSHMDQRTSTMIKVREDMNDWKLFTDSLDRGRISLC